MHLFHDHIEDLVALAEVVVEAQRHAVLDFTFQKGVLDGREELRALGIDDGLDARAVAAVLFAVYRMGAAEHILSGHP